MSVLSNFATACAEVTDPEVSGAAMLPVRLAIALTRALPVDAAAIGGLGLDDLRVPLGASSPDAELAERLEVTLGDGPCLAAFGLGYPVAATQQQIAQAWPIYFDRLVSETPFRSVASLPLQTPTDRLGAVDLYWTSPDGVTTLPMATALELADEVAAVLLAAPQVLTLDAVIAPAWVMATAAQRRMHVWQAVGMLNAARALSNRDAIAVLRAYAYAHDTTLDDLAEDLIFRRLTTGDVAP
ncbi:MAG: hypothetical protein DLM57_17695 [Pseudonocardiales bacterium]|nr:MAG: hypothetical protein DLM57_17695 [Pseudonocardiales bacterium]